MKNLANQLIAYKPQDDLERQCVETTLTFLQNNENAFERENEYGHITAGGLVVDKNGNILLNHHKKTNLWLNFGGHCDGDKDVENVAKREVLEECGFDFFDLKNLKIFDVGIINVPENTKHNSKQHFHFDINFLFVTNNKDFTISNESLNIKWVTICEAKKLIDKNELALLRMVNKYEIFLKTL